MVQEKMSKNLPPLRKQKLSKNAQEKDEKIKSNLQTDNWNWDGWEFYIYWKMLEWVKPGSKILRKKLFNILIKMIERLIGLAIHNLKH